MADLKMSRISSSLTVSPQLRPEDFPILAARGVRMVVNNRHDGEEPVQLTAAQAADLATANGMEYRHIPITLPAVSESDVQRFAEVLAGANGPVHAHCRSGLRSVTLWAIGEAAAGRLTTEQVKRAIEAAGYDAKSALTWLSGHHIGVTS